MKLRPVVFTFVWMLALFTSPALADYATGKRAYDQGDYATAAREWEEAANRGDSAAQFWLGTLYDSGKGVEKDELTGRRWQLMAAEGGYEYAQNMLGWPIKPDSVPYLTCTPYPAISAEASNAQKQAQADSMKRFQFQVTLHNWRPLLEDLIMYTENTSEKPKQPNVQILVYRIDHGHRLDVPYQVFGSGGMSAPTNHGSATYDMSLQASVRIPVEEAERRLYIEQFLARLAVAPGQTPEKVNAARAMMLHSEQPNRASSIDDIMPNRLGTYEIGCRYQSQKQGFWPDALEAPLLRFEYVKTMNWIDVFDRKSGLAK